MTVLFNDKILIFSGYGYTDSTAVNKICCALEQNPLHFTVARAQPLYERLQSDFESPKLEVYICMMVRYLIAFFQ